MFKCQSCGQSSPANTSPHTLITATRAKTYPVRYKIIPPKGREKKEEKIKVDNGGQGREIVQEIRVCEACAISQAE